MPDRKDGPQPEPTEEEERRSRIPEPQPTAEPGRDHTILEGREDG